MSSGGYHHGDLRRTLLAVAAEQIIESGVASVRLRELARRAGVSHTAPAHHFGDKAGLLTALASEGFTLLANALAEAGENLLDTGAAYIGFAETYRAHFEVMFDTTLYRADDPEVMKTRGELDARLRHQLSGMSGRADAPAARLAAWSIVHGFATLWTAGAIPHGPGDSAVAAGRPVIRLLFDEEA